VSWVYPLEGGKAFICGIDGARDNEVEALRAAGGMAKGGVEDRANGGEYDKATKAWLVVAVGDVPVPEAGLNDDTGRVTTEVLELGRRARPAGTREACSSSAVSLKQEY
jgi:hypothetical protein